MTLSKPPRPPRGRTPYLRFSGRIAALISGFWCGRGSAPAIGRPSIFPVPPVPPASRNGRANAETEKARGRAGDFYARLPAGSAKTPRDLMARIRKSLIVEANSILSHPVFATSRALFATSLNFVAAAVPSFFSLSKLLKKKKKEYIERSGIDPKQVPRVRRVLPSVADAAYFLGHESEVGATCF